jgi:hypothetical protein
MFKESAVLDRGSARKIANPSLHGIRRDQGIRRRVDGPDHRGSRASDVKLIASSSRRMGSGA